MTHLNGTTWSAFLTHLHRGGAYGYWWTLDEVKTFTYKHGPRAGQQDKCKRTYWWQVGNPTRIPRGTTEHVYFGVHPVRAIPQERTNKKTGEVYTPKPEFTRAEIADIAAINCLFAEFDAKDFAKGKAGALAHIERLEIPPSALIDSGGGYHAYWLLDVPTLITDTNREAVKDIQSRWVAWVGSDDGAQDLARVLRVPDRPNVKSHYAPDYPMVAFVAADFERLYALDDLATKIPPHVRAIEPRDPTPFTPTPGDHSAYVQAAYNGEVQAVRTALDGQKHYTVRDAAIKLAGLLWTGCITEAQIEDGIYSAVEQRAKDPGAAKQTILDGIAYGKARPRTIPNLPSKDSASTPATASDGQALSRSFIFKCLGEDEAGDAQLLTQIYRGRLVYDCSARLWYTFEAHVWTARQGPPRSLVWGAVAAVYLHLAADLQAEAGTASATSDDPKQAESLKSVERLTQRAKKLRSLNRINNVLALCQDELLLGVAGDIWDADPWLLGVANGVLDLRSGQLRDGRPADYIRIVAPTAWQGLQAPCPRWERFVSEVLSDESDRVAFLQRLLGYALNGTTSEHVLGIFVGERGRNGKRVLFEALQHVLGDYTKAVSTDVVIGQDRFRAAGSAQPHLMGLHGKRIAYCSETSEQAALSTAQVKNITGGDPITARWLHANPITFMPTHTLFLQTNYKPQAPAGDDALWERVKVIEFKVRFVDEPDKEKLDERPRDLGLERALRAEASGILAWLVRGGLDWQRGGLQTPESVKLARDTYRKEESIEPFLKAACVEAELLSAEGGALYAAYENYCKAHKLRAKSPVWFGKQLADRFEKGRVSGKGRTCYFGIGLEITEFEAPTADNPSHTPTTLHNPSQPIETPKNAPVGGEAYTVCEGLQSIDKSIGEKATHEGDNMHNPSHPSHPSQHEAECSDSGTPPGGVKVVDLPADLPKASRLMIERQRRQGARVAPTFVPTAEWQDIPDGAICPPGLEYRLSMSGEGRMARLPPQSEEQEPAQQAA